MCVCVCEWGGWGAHGAQQVWSHEQAWRGHIMPSTCVVTAGAVALYSRVESCVKEGRGVKPNSTSEQPQPGHRLVRITETALDPAPCLAPTPAPVTNPNPGPCYNPTTTQPP